MTEPDIEVLDDSQGYPYSSHISVEGTEVQHGDLLLVFESGESRTVDFFERVYVFTWKGIITHLIDGPLPAEFREFEEFAEDKESGRIAVVPEREQASFFKDDETIRTVSLYQYIYQEGMQPILVDEQRDPIDRDPYEQRVTLCGDSDEVIEELFSNTPPASVDESRHLRKFLLAAGYNESSLPESDEAQLNQFTE
ncbi:hypothetical protein GCM10009037_26640 [Halarchaeum grantii]|uniref:Uncharacterized protein n=1 Tax=Halarchaeum grantii TaxID=1193105 RepID=A0A830EYB3_9EURY|nr:hypothetical protein [Halarchaeum grantii]GGL41700.1 hypothetical protein GCM10009037_26640 [Halarchaeum grantii]